MKIIGKAIVRYYKQCINPLIGGRCIYTPSCSAYMAQAIDKFGLIKGGAKGVYRLIRCNPFSKGGFDPIKENFRGRAKWLL